eukprot:c24252_g1_i1 orf=660-1514(-)
MASASSSAFFSRSIKLSGGKQFWKKVGVGASVAAAAAAVVGVQYKSPSLCASLPSASHSASPWNFLPLACLAPLSDPPPSFIEPSTGASFPVSIAGDATQLQLAGTGLRKKCIFGLKNITVYAFGVYTDEASLKDKLAGKYTQQSAANLKENKSFYDDIMASDLDMTVRLVIVYGRLKIGSVRSAFEESLGGRIKKFSGTENLSLLHSFTSLFKDDIKLPRETTIDVTRHSGHILTTKINGMELGSVQSALLCRAFLDLYIGEDPFDVKGREDIGSKLAAVINS